MNDLAAALDEMTVESAIGNVLGYFVDDNSLPDDIRVALTRIVIAAGKKADPITAEEVEAVMSAFAEDGSAKFVPARWRIEKALGAFMRERFGL